MRIKNIIITLSLMLLFAACNNEGSRKFKVSGAIEGAVNQPILIETMSFPNMNGQPLFTTIDTATTDAEGAFELSGNLKERSISRIKLVNRPDIYFLLNIKDESVQVTGSMNEPEKQTIEGSAPSTVLNNFIKELRYKNIEIVEFDNQVLSQSQALGDSLTAIMEERLEGMIDGYYEFVVQFADTTQLLTNKIVAMENLLYEVHFDLILQKADKILPTADTSSVYIQELSSKVNRYKAIQEQQAAASFIGKHFSDISLPNQDGRILKLSDVQGKVILLDFWASWCRPCREENPNLVRTYNDYKSQGFEIYSVSLDDNANNWKKAVIDDGLAWQWHVQQQKEGTNHPSDVYNVNAIPANFLINSEGNIVAENLRGEELENAVAELLAGNR